MQSKGPPLKGRMGLSALPQSRCGQEPNRSLELMANLMKLKIVLELSAIIKKPHAVLNALIVKVAVTNQRQKARSTAITTEN